MTERSNDLHPAKSLLTRDDLKKFGITLSNTQLLRLEARNCFVRRIYIGSRPSWIRAEIEAWVEARAAERAHRVYSVY